MGLGQRSSPETRNFLSGVISCRGLLERTAVNGELPHRKDTHSLHEESVSGFHCVVFPAGAVLSSTKLDLLLNRKKRWSTASKDEISLPQSGASIME